MVLGQNCAFAAPINADGLAKAKARVADFGFVGLQEHWNASVCLFHRQFGAPMHITELINLRPGAGQSREVRSDVSRSSREELSAQDASKDEDGQGARRRLLAADDDQEQEQEQDDDDEAQGKGDVDLSRNVLTEDNITGLSSYHPGLKEGKAIVSNLARVDKSAAESVLPEHDPHDHVLYGVAVKLFKERLAQYGLRDIHE